ncbi:tetratricopeptide repeat protein [Brevibacterium ravenspurgense]|uniref:tetratricopeptide repeat protein n=1 Tax=Brevibacterium ravenspurgense TaxID=479117 RepID=UPI0002DAED1A|nr:tetratricopeptide repeat protein [Brevibacterium ravenspurgense]
MTIPQQPEHPGHGQQAGGPQAGQPNQPGQPGPQQPDQPGAQEGLDLSAVRGHGTSAASAPGGAAQSSDAPGPNQVEVPALAFEVNEQTFESAARLSMELPVVLVLYSGQQPESQQILPAMQKVVEDQAGRAVLGLVDVATSPAIQQAFQVQALPTVVAVIKGQPVPLFQGMQPETQIRQLFDQIAQAASQAGLHKTAWVKGAPGQQGPRHPEALEALEAGDLDRAEQVYKNALAESPADDEAKAGIARVGLLRRTRDKDLAAVRQAAADNPTSVEAAIDCADLDVAGGHVEDAFTRLITFIGTTAGDDREKLRVHLLDLFDAVGAEDARVVKARGRLMRALF